MLFLPSVFSVKIYYRTAKDTSIIQFIKFLPPDLKNKGKQITRNDNNKNPHTHSPLKKKKNLLKKIIVCTYHSDVESIKKIKGKRSN